MLLVTLIYNLVLSLVWYGLWLLLIASFFGWILVLAPLGFLIYRRWAMVVTYVYLKLTKEV